MKNKGFLILVLFVTQALIIQAQWTTVNVGASNALHAVQYQSSSLIFLGGDDGLTKSLDGGTTWSTLPLVDNFGSPIYGSSLYSVHFFDATTGIATGSISASNSEVILRTTNGGTSWSYVSTNNNGNWPRALNDMSFFGLSNGIAVGTNGRILRTTNNGSSWSAITSGTTNELKSVHFINSTTGFIVGNKVILKSTNGGTSWTLTNSIHNLNSVRFVNSLVGYASGNVILKTVDGGTTWKQISTLSGNDIYPVDADSAFVCNEGIYKTINGGTYWGAQSLVPTNLYWNDIDFLNKYNGYVVGNNGLVYKTSSSGQSFPQNDIGVYSVEPYSPLLCPATYPVRVKIKNYGLQTLTNAIVEWSVNGVAQTPFNWSGSLPVDSITPYLTIGNFPFGFAAQQVEAYTRLPNGINDQFTGNDKSSTTFKTEKLNGTYTIGTSANFTSFSDAINALNTYGLCGAVIFKVKDGIYQEAISFSNIPGTSSINSITFESENGDSSKVILTSSTTTVILNAAKHITLKKLSIKSTGGVPVEFINGAESNFILNNILETTNVNSPIINTSGSTSKNLTINNNLFVNGYSGISYNGTTTSYGTGIVIQKNKFQGQAFRAVNLNLTTSPVISENIITTSSTNTSYGAIFLQSSNGNFKIEKNKISISLGSGISITSCNNSLGNEGLVANNFINSGSGTYSGIGISVANSYYQNIFNNTVYITGSSTFSSALNMHYTDTNNFTNVSVVNNILTNTSKGLIYKITNSKTNLTSSYYRKVFKIIDKNAYYFNGSIFAYLEYSNNITSHEIWKITFNKDLNSILADPQFTSVNDLHIYLKTSNYQLNNAGMPLAEVTDDIDSNLRDVTAPDIGADEFNIPVVDASLLSFEKSVQYCAGTTGIGVKIKNFGTTTLTTAKINWKVNGITQPQFIWIGNLASGNESAYVNIGSTNLTLNSTYVIQAWIANPNNSSDEIAANDSIAQTITAKGLAGTYTIGGSSPDYATFTAANNDLALKGVCSPVTFNVRPGVYNEQVSFVPIPGASEENRVTFQSENGDSTSVLITFSGTSTNNYTLQLNGADYLTFKGLSFEGTNTTYTRIVYIKSSSNGNHFKNNVFNGLPNPVNYSDYVIFSADTSVDEYNIIQHNRFINGTFAIKMIGKNHSTGPVYTYERGNVIRNNVFEKTKLMAMVMEFQQDLTIKENSIDLVVPSYLATSSSGGIWIKYCLGKTEITKNSIYGNASSGIVATRSRSIFSQKGIIANNFVGLTGSSPLGIGLDYTEFFEISFNNILISNSSSTNSRALYLFCLPGSEISLHNNNFINYAGGHCIYSQFPPSSVIVASNNNNWFTNGKALTNFGDSTLFDWQQKYNLDKNSLSVKPEYVAFNDLHINNNFYLKRSGTPISGITQDIDNQQRNNLTPDIGADEFNITQQADDAGVFEIVKPGLMCRGQNDVKVILKNYGTNSLTTATINLKVNGIIQTPVIWTGTLAPWESTEVNIGTFNFQETKAQELTTWTTNPNNQTDLVASNDTATWKKIYTRLNGNYTIGAEPSDYLTVTAACNALSKFGICGPVTFNIKNGTYNEQISLKSIYGTNVNNTITFQSASGNYEDVIVNGGVLLDGADYITIKGISLLGGCNLQAGAVKNQILSNYITTSSQFAGVSISGGNNNYNEFRKNIINTRINSSATTSLPDRGLIIEENKITFSGTAVYILASDSVQVRGNIIKGNSNSGEGIILQNSKSINRITKNYIQGPFYRGIHIAGVTSAAGQETEISNNSIFSGLNWVSSYVGISVQSSNYLNVFYNSVHIYNASGQCFSYDGNFSGNVKNINNNYVNTGGGVALWINKAATLSSNYNNLYTTGSSLVYYGPASTSTYYSTLADYISASGKDGSSISEDPFFISPEDLHFTSAELDGKATPISSIINDIENNVRNASSPDPGAFEVIIKEYNADLITVAQSASFCQGNNDIKVNVKNQGTKTLTSLKFSFEVNGVIQPPFQWTGSLAPGEVQNDIIIGSFNFQQATNYNIKKWSSLPNGNPDEDTSNDTLIENNLLIPLNGTLTIGGNNPNYATITDAVNDLKTFGICNKVTFNIRDGIYNEQISVPLIAGVDPDKTITFISESMDSTAVIITYSSSNADSNYTFRLNGANFINLKNLTIEASGTTYSRVLNVENSASYIISGNILKNKSISTSCYTCELIYSTMGGSFNSVVENNLLLNGSYGLFFTGSSSAYNGLIIRKNRFVNQLHGGVLLEFQHGTEISENEISSLASSSFNMYYKAIQTRWSDMNSVISKNRIHNVFGTGILVEDCSYNTVSNNFVQVFGNNSSIPAYGIACVESSYQSYFHNSVNLIDSINLSSAAMLIERTWTACIELDLKNNMFINSKGGLSLALKNIGTINTSWFWNTDHNNLYSTGSKLVSWSTTTWDSPTTYLTLSSWQATSEMELNSVSVDPLYTSYSDLHPTNYLICKKGISVSIPDDIDYEPRDPNFPDIGADEYSGTLTSVWPGDTDNDNVVTNFDLLPVALHFGEVGNQRLTVSNTWQGHFSLDWATSQVNGWNTKFADCNGDGSINYNDTMAITVYNPGKTHKLINTPLPPQNVVSSNPDIFFVSTSSTFNAGEWVELEIRTGSVAEPVLDLYGIAFNVGFNPLLVEAGSMSLNYSQNWFTRNNNKLSLSKEYGSGILQGAITRIDHVDTNGYGLLGILRFKAKSTLSQSDSLKFAITKYKAIDASGASLTFDLRETSININSTTNLKIRDKIGGISLYPNPAKSEVLISNKSSLQITQLVVYSMEGRKVLEIDEPNHSEVIKINITGMAPGVYYLECIGKEGRYKSKFIKQ